MKQTNPAKGNWQKGSPIRRPNPVTIMKYETEEKKKKEVPTLKPYTKSHPKPTPIPKCP
jgi:hypothetical protein